MIDIATEPLTAAGFAPFGDVFAPPDVPGRTGSLARFRSDRAEAGLALSMTTAKPAILPLMVTKFERHPHSSQAFLPLDMPRFLVVVAPGSADTGPDLSQARAFVGTGPQAFNYMPDVWHAGFEVLGTRGSYAVLIWRDGSEADTIVFDLSEPLCISEV